MTKPTVAGVSVAALLVFGGDVRRAAAGTCPPCFGGDEPDGDEASGFACSALLSSSAQLEDGTEACDSRHLENFQLDCCRRGPRHCTMCPDGSSFDASTPVGDSTCAEVNGNPEYVKRYVSERGTCDDTFLRRSAAWCGCPGVDRGCHLCPDGSEPPRPEIVEPVYYGSSCGAFDLVSSYYSADECPTLTERILQFDAASFCGCPGATAPAVCDLCPDGEEVVDPDRVLVSGSKRFTCSELARSTSFIPTENLCAGLLSGHRKDGFVDGCCGVPNVSAASRTGDLSTTGVATLAALMLLKFIPLR